MDKLLHHYERELGRLRQATREYAAAHPVTADALELRPEASTDPEVERLLQSVALLNAAMQQLIEQGRSEFHKALLHTLQPHYLRVIPACGVAQVDTAGAAYNRVNSVSRIPRGTIMSSGDCKFITAYEVCVAPFAITQAKFRPTIDVPATLRLPADATSTLSLVVECTSGSSSFDQPLLPKLRVWVTGESTLRASVIDALFMQSLCICLESDGDWKILPGGLFTKVGFERTESLLPISNGGQAPRILTEYMHLPEKFDFFDIELAQLASHCRRECRQAALHIVLPKIDAPLKQVCAANFRLSCTPLINLFGGTALQIRLDGRKDAYQVPIGVPGCELYSIDSVALMHRSGDKEFLPFHGASHDEHGVFWKLEEQEGAAIALVDRNQRPANTDNGTALVEITCTNGEALLVEEVLRAENWAGGFPIRFLSMPNRPTRYEDARAIMEALQSCSISLDSIRQLFQVHGFKKADAFKCLTSQAASAWMDLPMGRMHMLGTEYSLTIDEELLRDRSVTVLAGVLEHVLSAKSRENRFIQLGLLRENGEAIYRGQPKIGKQRIA